MLIELIDQFRVRVILDDPDMEALGISYADLLFGTDTLGPALRQLLLRVCTQTGFDPRQRKLLIEVYPGETGGCILYFSALNPLSASSSTNTSSGSSTSPARYRIKERNIAPYLFRFQDADTLINACRSVFTHMSQRVLRSSLYYLGGYILSVTPLDGSENGSVHLLKEYADCLGRSAILEAVIDEHGKALCPQNAVGKLAGKSSGD